MIVFITFGQYKNFILEFNAVLSLTNISLCNVGEHIVNGCPSRKGPNYW